ncbi:MAG: SpoIIE family protein phosphatase [Mycobacterium sp.]
MDLHRQLDRHLGRLLSELGAHAALILVPSADSTAGSVIHSCPGEIVSMGTILPLTGNGSGGPIRRDSAIVANFIPVTECLRCPTAATTLLQLETPDPGLLLLLIGCDPSLGDRLSDNHRQLVDREITNSARALQRQYRDFGDVVSHIRDGRIVWVSPSVEDVFGAPPSHWLGREVREFIPQDELSDYAGWTQTLLEGGVIKERIRVKSLDGTAHWVHLHARPFLRPDGHHDGVTVAFRLADDDVSVQLDAEEARRRQARADARYRRLMDNAAIGMCFNHPDGSFEAVNDALCQLLGYDAETLTSKTWQELTVPGYVEADLQKIRDILTGRIDSYRTIKQYIHADGHPIWGDLSVSCVRDENGRVEVFISQISDVTAAVEANERNHVLTQRLQEQGERLSRELRSAAAYMSSIMPRDLTGPVRVSSRYLPSRELGGDCFDYTWIDDDHFLVYLIDVSGHGIEPALLSVSLHNMLRSGFLPASSLMSPETALSELNRRFQMDQQNNHFFTVWFGVYEMSSRTLRYASAGAPPALAFQSGAGAAVTVTELSANAVPVGMFADTVFAASTVVVPPGCQILVYSDGASEVDLPDGHQLSTVDFKHLVTRIAESPDWSLDDLLDQLHSLTPAGVFEDDCSLIQLTFD